MTDWRKWLNSRPDDNVVEENSPLSLDTLRTQMLASLRDCQGPLCERMRWRIDAAHSAHDLWLLRSEVFQLVAGQHCQAEAAARINGLLPAFEGWVPARMLTRI